MGSDFFAGREEARHKRLNGVAPLDAYGRAAPGGGDINHDGLPDIIVGATNETAAGLVGTIRVVSPITLPAASALVVGTGCGEGPLPPELLSTAPVLGHQLTVLVANAAPNALGSLLFSAVPTAPLPLGAGCALHVNPAAPFALAPVATDPTGAGLITLQLPASPHWAGTQVSVQAVVLPTGGPLGFDLTNALRVTLGF